MDEAEKAAMEKLSRGGMRALPEKSLYHLIEEQTGGSVVDGENEYSLSDLKRDAAKIDAAVRRKNRGEAGGETREEKRVIAILCERSYVELAAIYGVIRGGNAYLPISPEFPPERIEAILGISGCDTVLAQRKYRHLVSGALVMEELLDQPDPSPTLPAAALPDDLLYVIFTSGSTGQPKGAMVSNRSAVNRILWMADRYFSPETTVMLKTPYTFDVSVWEIFGFAVAGFRLYILPPFDHYRQDRVIEHIRRGKVTDIHFVPSVFSSFLNVLEESGEELDTLKNIFLSGEALPASLVHRAPVPVHNLYGPTECAVDVTYYDCTGTETDPVPIGFPVDNCRMHVLDRDLQPVPAGVRGQICISGVQVGRGYLHDPARTAERFVPDPFGPGDMYLTGDIGYWNDEGAIVYVGRNDRQVKINGQRIEPEEVETALTQLVPEAAVIVEDNRLIAFYTGGERPSLRKELGRILPAYMIPHSFTHVKEMPRMSSGKTDRGALMKIPREERTCEAPVNGTERAICALFAEVLQKEKVGRNDSFFDLGGTSLDLLSLLSSPLLEQLSPPDMMTHSSPAELAGLLDSRAVPAGNRAEALSDSRGEGTEAPVKPVGSGVNDLSDSRGEAAGPLMPLYLPDRPFRTGIVLFPYAGGDASAYTALVAEFRKRQAPAALYFLPWAEDPDICENLDACTDKSPGSDEDPGSRKSPDTCERLDHCGSPDIWDSLDAAQAQIRKLAERMEIRFYSHCAGSAIALKLLEKLNASQRIVSRYFAGADIPPSRAENLWEAVSDRELMDILSQAGMPELPEDRAYDLIARFRSNTREYFDFFGSRREKVPCRVTLILSRNDLFTRDYRDAVDRWSQYVTGVESVHYIDAPTHYFQAAEATVLADILLSDIFSS